jgi:hypothetical protein
VSTLKFFLLWDQEHSGPLAPWPQQSESGNTTTVAPNNDWWDWYVKTLAL